MYRRMMTGTILATLAMAGLSGCMPKMTMEEMAQMRPERPVELDKLNAWVGTWKASGTVKMMGIDEEITLSGTSQNAWGVDRWCLLEHGEYEMGAMGKMNGLGVWTWDTKAKRFRSNWFDSMGGTGSGTAKYDEMTRTWTMNMRGKGPGGATRGKGYVRFVDDDTMEWAWQEWPAWDLLGLFKFMDMKATSTRQ
ncbi:MAG: DUF1579 family protein [Planctomycetes bacterium]|nr:DUF1579 family protein [Planctomycetota bacterium]